MRPNPNQPTQVPGPGRKSTNPAPSIRLLAVKETRYFATIRTRPDRAIIEGAWIERAIREPVRQAIQEDGRIRRWALVPEMGNRYLRVVLLEDGMTVHNAFFDRGFEP